MDNKTRIENEAKKYVFEKIDSVVSKENGLYRSYIAGATAEQERPYNKGWNDAIDLVLKKCIRERDFIQYVTWDVLEKEIEALKIH